ncbi:MAG: SGNH/GDSL hydrolase family protein [Dethiosulfatibacter sp.]|nr:SGNH/GDSL hydrolase family protein [Dethiosulfatibacter sp.]
MFFKKFKTFIALTMVIMLLFSITAFATAKQGITYTALGDSIAYGTGATDGIGYTDMFNAHLERKFGDGMYINLSADGVTSGGLLYALSYPGDPLGVQAAVYGADVITISIGGNDLLGPFQVALNGFIAQFYSIPGGGGAINFEAFMSDFAKWEMDQSTQPGFTAMLASLYSDWPDLVQNFAVNWARIIDIIEDLNPDADIYVNTVFNPLKFSPALYEFADQAIQGLNIPIMSLAPVYGYKVVDVYSKFSSYNNPKKLAVGDLSTLAVYKYPGYNGPVPLHPTDMGYKFIFNMHKDLMD